jgi:sialate O-acetylesterase
MSDKPEAFEEVLAGKWLDNHALEPWCQQRARENLGKLNNIPGLGPAHPFRPGFLWDAGIATLEDFPIKGVLWAQGESNSLSLKRVVQHERWFPELVASWRHQWQNPILPFFFCQLSGISTNGGYKAEYWPEFRWSQWGLAKTVPNTGCVVLHDLGHPTDVHPKEKREVGRRLAALVLSKVYDKPEPWAGPLPEKISREEGTIVLAFPCPIRLSGPDAINTKSAFSCAAADRTFKPVEALIQGSLVTLVDPPKNAQFVRHAWQPMPTCYLTDAAGLPVTTFELHIP